MNTTKKKAITKLGTTRANLATSLTANATEVNRMMRANNAPAAVILGVAEKGEAERRTMRQAVQPVASIIEKALAPLLLFALSACNGASATARLDAMTAERDALAKKIQTITAERDTLRQQWTADAVDEGSVEIQWLSNTIHAIDAVALPMAACALFLKQGTAGIPAKWQPTVNQATGPAIGAYVAACREMAAIGYGHRTELSAATTDMLNDTKKALDSVAELREMARKR